MARVTRTLAAVFLLAAAASASACGGKPISEEGEAPTSSVGQQGDPASSAGREVSPENPLRVLLAGDSVMAGLAPPIEFALDEGGSGDAEFVLTPTIARDSANQALWESQLRERDPDLVVMLVGQWESMVLGQAAVAQGATDEQYVAGVLQPFVDLVTSEGAVMLWLGMPPVQRPEISANYARLNGLVQELAARNPTTVHYLATEDSIAPNGFVEVVTNPDGTAERLRSIDGHHLCPSGAARAATPVLDWITSRWAIDLAPDWPAGTWRDPGRYIGSEECPPP